MEAAALRAAVRSEAVVLRLLVGVKVGPEPNLAALVLLLNKPLVEFVPVCHNTLRLHPRCEPADGLGTKTCGQIHCADKLLRFIHNFEHGNLVLL